MFAHWAFDLVLGVYSVLTLGLVRILWIARTPIDASIHRLRAPKLDKHAAELRLSSSSDVGVI